MTMHPTATVVGWDVGGAHVKAALLRNGRLEAVRQWPCALWQGLHLLDRVIDDALASWSLSGPGGQASHAVTMTGEMVDLFEHREDGVVRLARLLGQRLGPDLRLFSSAGDWLDATVAQRRWPELASANWAATARLVASRVRQATLVDVGSTTTDLIPLAGGQVHSVGTSDAQRLQSGELLYQGVVRTPLCALTQRIVFRGAQYNVMNEWFATTADVYRLTGELDPAHDQHPAADGGAKDEAGSCRRIARMIGHDAHDGTLAEWQAFAQAWRSHQLALVRAELQRVESRGGKSPGYPTAATALVGAGCGRFLVRALAQALERPFVTFDELLDVPPALRDWACVCAPAVAVALLRGQACANPSCG